VNSEKEGREVLFPEEETDAPRVSVESGDMNGFINHHESPIKSHKRNKSEIKWGESEKKFQSNKAHHKHNKSAIPAAPMTHQPEFMKERDSLMNPMDMNDRRQKYLTSKQIIFNIQISLRKQNLNNSFCKRRLIMYT
jgi:hypothetical protein